MVYYIPLMSVVLTAVVLFSHASACDSDIDTADVVSRRVSIAIVFAASEG